MNLNKIIKVAISMLVIAGLFDWSNIQEISAEETVTPEVQSGKTNEQIYKPEALEPGHDGYSYLRPGTVHDPRTDEDMYQIWAYMFGHSRTGWTAYVGENSRTLFIVGDLSDGETLGVGSTSSSGEYLYEPAVFQGRGYEGDILSVQGSTLASLILTSEGELWYTGENTGNIFFNGSSSYDSMDVWNKMEFETTIEGKIIDAVLAHDALIFITDAGKMYASGNIARRTDDTFFKNFYGTAVPHTDVTSELNGEIPSRLFSQGMAPNHTELEKWFIVETDQGYLGSGYDEESRASASIGATDSSTGDYLTGRNTEGDLSGSRYDGLLPVMYQSKPAGGYSTTAGDAPLSRMPAGFVEDFVDYGADNLVHALGVNGKIYTTGVTQYGNSSGTHHTNFQGWDNNRTNITMPDNSNYTDTASLNVSWNTNVFSENEAWGDDNEIIYPGIKAMVVRKSDGELYHVGEIQGSTGVVPSQNPDAYQCLGAGLYCYTAVIRPLEGLTDPYFYSTTWNKTAEMKREWTLSVWHGSMAVDQDGFLRVTARERSYQELAVENQAIFPIINDDSTIRTVENFENISDYDYLGDKENRQVEANRTNARVSGEYMLLDTVTLVSPEYQFDGDRKVDGGLDGTINPYNITIGPIYSGKYSLSEDGTSTEDAVINVNYSIKTYDPTTDTYGTSSVLSDVVDISDDTTNVDISSLQPGWYIISSHREYTATLNEGTSNERQVTYELSQTSEYFYIPNEPIITIANNPLVIDSSSTFPVKIAEGNTAITRPNTDVSSNIYILRNCQRM